MKIRTKIGGGFLALIFILILVNLASMKNLKVVDALTSQAASDANHLHLISELSLFLLKQSYESQKAFQGDKDAWTRFNAYDGRFRQTLGDIYLAFKGIENAEKEDLIVRVAQKQAEYASAVREAYELYLNYRPTAAEKVISEQAEPAMRKVLELGDEQIRWQKKQVRQIVIASTRGKNGAIKENTFLLVVSIVVSALFAVFLVNWITKPILALSEGMKIIGSGDMDYRVGAKSKDEIGQLSRAFDSMAVNLKETMRRLERSNRDLQQFAYVASHDLQEPLRMVASYLQLLERRYKGKLDADADDFINFAVDGARRMQTLIQDLLQYSRVEMRGNSFEPADFESILETVLDGLQVMIKENRAVVTHDPLPTVACDKTQIAQLLHNLIANGIRFRGESPPEISLSARRGKGEWIFSVRDNGIGIDSQYFERIFVIFQRLHGKKEYPDGTGIGLAVCKSIVERHGGRIWVDSEPGKGSLFQFSMPNVKER